ncbi:MAG: hypothetical protein ABIB97_05730 [Patescibacteria group bacterium]
MSEQKKGFHPIGFALPWIFAACVFYIATKLGLISLFCGGMCILIFVAIPHGISLKRCLEMGKTVSGIIFFCFFGLWIYLGSSLILVSLGLMEMEELEKSLMFAEAVIALDILVFLRYYWKEMQLWITLLCLDAVVFALAISKLFICFTRYHDFGHGLDRFSLVLIGLLGAWLWPVIHNLNKAEARE